MKRAAANIYNSEQKQRMMMFRVMKAALMKRMHVLCNDGGAAP